MALVQKIDQVTRGQGRRHTAGVRVPSLGPKMQERTDHRNGQNGSATGPSIPLGLGSCGGGGSVRRRAATRLDSRG